MIDRRPLSRYAGAMKMSIYGVAAGFVLGLVLATGTSFVAGGMSKRRVDDWRHLHAWGSWVPGLLDGQPRLTRICSSCGRWQIINAKLQP